MTKDLFAETRAGKIALQKIKPESANFRLYSVGWLETGAVPRPGR